MKKTKFVVLSLMLLVSVQSCKKQLSNNATNVNAPMVTTEADKQLLSKIETFYAKMKSLKGSKGHSNAKTTATDVFSKSDAELLTEATYNYYVARQDISKTVTQVTFSVTEPMADANDIDALDVSDAFWKIKDQLLSSINNINFPDKKLENFDVKIDVNNGIATFHVFAAITNGTETNPFTGSATQFSNPSNHAWSAAASNEATPNVQPYGQADLVNNSGVVSILNVNNTIPAAGSALRAAALYDYHNSHPFANLLYTNYQTKYVGKDINLPNNIVANSAVSPTPYNSMTSFTGNMTTTSYYNNIINGGFGQNVYGVNKFYNDYDQQSFTYFRVANNEEIYKDYLMTDLMNFYHNSSMDFINNNTPSGMLLADFNVCEKECICSPYLFYQFSTPLDFLWFHSKNFYYVMTYANATTIPLPDSYINDLSSL